MPILLLIVVIVIVGIYLYTRGNDKFTRGGDINKQGEEINEDGFDDPVYAKPDENDQKDEAPKEETPKDK